MKPCRAIAVPVVFVTLILGAARSGWAQDCEEKTWTLPADVEDGFGINVDTSGEDGLQVNPGTDPAPLPFIWVAKSGQNTIVKIDVNSSNPNSAVLGEYKSGPGQTSWDPSRTTVDLFGNVWTSNRAASPGSVVKIGLVIGGTRNGQVIEPPFDYCTCVDRDGDRVITTSYGLGNILDWGTDGLDQNGGLPDCGDHIGDARVEEAEDECILLFQRLHSEGTRHISVDGAVNVWVGGTGNGGFDLLDQQTGEVLKSFTALNGDGSPYGYGGIIDGTGILWSATEGTERDLLRYNTLTGQRYQDVASVHSYGLGIDTLCNVWNSQWTEDKVTKSLSR